VDYLIPHLELSLFGIEKKTIRELKFLSLTTITTKEKEVEEEQKPSIKYLSTKRNTVRKG
jgi:hypothetical protein